MKRLNFNLPDELWAELERVHKLTELTVTVIIKRALLEYLKRPEFRPASDWNIGQPAFDNPARPASRKQGRASRP